MTAPSSETPAATLAFQPWPPGELAPLAAVLARGGVLVLPTESSYALASDPRNREGVAAVYRWKGRAGSKPLPVMVADREQILGLGLRWEAPFAPALEACWPAPLTAVVPFRRPEAMADSVPAAAGGGTLAVRIPAPAALRSLLTSLGPLTATSANRSEEAPWVEPAQVARSLHRTGSMGTEVLIFDGGRLSGSAPSTLVAWEDGNWQTLRPGPFPVERLEAATRGV